MRTVPTVPVTVHTDVYKTTIEIRKNTSLMRPLGPVLSYISQRCLEQSRVTVSTVLNSNSAILPFPIIAW